MRRQRLLILFIAAHPAGWANAQIARPDAILYGTIYVDGKPAPVSSALAVVARAGGFDQPLAAYQLGDVPAVENRFLLHIPQAFSEDGHTPSPTTAPTGRLLKLYVQPPGGAEVYAGETALPASGSAVEVSLNVSGSELEVGRNLPRSLFQSCGGGGGTCGAFGLINMAALCGGLGLLRRRARGKDGGELGRWGGRGGRRV